MLCSGDHCVLARVLCYAMLCYAQALTVNSCVSCGMLRVLCYAMLCSAQALTVYSCVSITYRITFDAAAVPPTIELDPAWVFDVMVCYAPSRTLHACCSHLLFTSHCCMANPAAQPSHTCCAHGDLRLTSVS